MATFAFKKTDPSMPDAKALVFDPGSRAAGKHSLGSLLPLLKALRSLVTAVVRSRRDDLMRPDRGPERSSGESRAATTVPRRR